MLKICDYFDDLDKIASSKMALAVFLDLVHLLNGATKRKSMPTLLALKGLLSIVLWKIKKGLSRIKDNARSSDQESQIFDGLNNLLHFIINSGNLSGKGHSFSLEHPTEGFRAGVSSHCNYLCFRNSQCVWAKILLLFLCLDNY